MEDPVLDCTVLPAVKTETRPRSHFTATPWAMDNSPTLSGPVSTLEKEEFEPGVQNPFRWKSLRFCAQGSVASHGKGLVCATQRFQTGLICQPPPPNTPGDT